MAETLPNNSDKPVARGLPALACWEVGGVSRLASEGLWTECLRSIHHTYLLLHAFNTTVILERVTTTLCDILVQLHYQSNEAYTRHKF